MNKECESKLKFVDYFVSNLKYSINDDFDDENTVKLKINIIPNFKLEDDNILIVELTCLLFEKGEEYPFYLELTLVGTFEFNNSTEKEIENYKKVNTVSILFPYVRAIISNITTLMNVNPVILPTINVVNLIEIQNKN